MILGNSIRCLLVAAIQFYVFPMVLIWFFFLSSSLLATGHANAQEQVYELGQITVEALGEENLKKELRRKPAMIEVITQEDIKKMDIKTAWDFLRNISGISVNDYAGGAIGYMNRLSIRGISYILGEPYAVFLDDVPLNEPGSWNPNHTQADLFAIPAESIDHIEVIKGPFSIDSGDFNLLGVIKFYTKKYSEKSDLSVAGGSYGYNRAVTSLSSKFCDDWRVFAAGEFQRQDGYADKSDLHHLGSGRINLTYGAPTPGRSQTTLSFGVYDLDTQLPGGLSKQQWEAGMYKFAFNHTDGREKTQLDTSLVNDWVINENNNFVNLLWFRTYDSQRWEDTGNIWGDGVTHDQREQEATRHNFGYRGKYRLHGNLFDRYGSMIIGVDYRRDDITNDRWRTRERERLPGGNFQKQDILYQDLGFYISTQYELLRDLTLYAALRWDEISYDIDEIVTPSGSKKWSDSVLSPKIGLTYSLTDDIVFFGQFATGSMTPDPRFIAEDKLTDSMNYEIGCKSTFFDKSLELQTSLFLYRINNWPLFDREKLVYLSVGEVESKGFEIALRYHLLPSVSWFLNYGYNDTHFLGDAMFRNLPLDDIAGADPWNLGTGIDWRFKFGLSGRLEYLVNGRGWVWYDYQEKEEYYHNIRLKMNYDFLDRYTAFVFINNLLNQEGKVPWPYASFYRPEPGIVFTAGLTVTF